MEVYGNGGLEQGEKNKPRARCRKWKIRFRTECGTKAKFFVGSYREAQVAKDNFCTELLEDTNNSAMTFEKYAHNWLSLRKQNPDLSPNTIVCDERMVKTLVYGFGEKRLQDINPMLIKEIIPKFCSVTGASLSGTGKQMHFSTFSSIMKSAVDDGLIENNPMNKVKMPKRDTREKKCLTKPEMDKYIECLDNEEQDGRVFCMYFMLYLALRMQEAVALKGEDVDFDNKKIHIRRAYKQADGSVGLPKSKAGVRRLPIPEPFFVKLEEWHDKCIECRSNVEGICPTTLNSIMTPSAMRKGYSRFKSKYNLKHVSFHELRHSNLTYASHRMSEFDLQKYAGWSSMDPVRIYIHFDDQSLTDSIAEMF